MVKIRKPKKENKEVLSIENPEVLNDGTEHQVLSAKY